MERIELADAAPVRAGASLPATDSASDAALHELEAIYDSAPIGLAVLDRDLRFRRINSRLAELNGIPPEAHIGRTVRELLPDVADAAEPLLRQVLETGEPRLDVELVGQTPAQPGVERVWVEQWLPIRDGDGRVVGVNVVTLEVTEQRRLLRETRAARDRTERLQRLTAALAAATTVTAVTEIVVSEGVVATGAAAGSLLLVDPADETQLVVMQRRQVPDAIFEAWMRVPVSGQTPAAECTRTGEPSFVGTQEELATRFPPMASAFRTMGTRALATLPVRLGQTRGAVAFSFEEERAFAEDERAFLLTFGEQCAQALERIRLTAADHAARADAEAARAEAERANRAKGEFLAVMSHELRTPLNAIAGYAELIEMGLRGPVSAQQRADLGRIRQSQRHLLGLINQVLNYTRIETGTVRYDIAAVLVSDALAAAEALIVPQVRAKGLRYVMSGCDPQLRARADAEKLQQILLNVLGNAVKFTDSGGEISVCCAGDAEGVTITVRDTGIGIDADKLADIFEPFVQVDQRLTRAAEGIGLGLAISRDLARGMGGDLTVESVRGAGSAFTLRLPG